MTDKQLQQPQLDALIQVRCPQQLTTIIKRAATANGITASAYVRAAVVARLHEDGAQAA